MSSYKCPKCGSRKFKLTISQTADVTFDEDGDHEVTDGPYGDLEFGEKSHASCASADCCWSGDLIEATDDEREIMVCGKCGSPRISFEAMIEANSDRVSSGFDIPSCSDCNCDTKELTVSVPPGFDMASGRVQVGTAN